MLHGHTVVPLDQSVRSPSSDQNTIGKQKMYKVLKVLFAFVEQPKNLITNVMGIFLIGVIVRVTMILVGGTYSAPRHFELELVAISLSEVGSYANAFGSSSGPTAHFAPIYPIFLALIFKIFGTDVMSELIRQVFNTVFIAFHYALLPFLAKACRLPVSAGVLAGLLGAILPFHFLSEVRGQESALAALALVCLCLLSLKYMSSRNIGQLRAVILGVSWGVGALITPSLIPVLGGFMFLRGITSYGDSFFSFIKEVATIGVVIALVLSPWAIRNYIQLGDLIWTRSSLGVELNMSNNDLASAAWLDNTAGREKGGHPWESTSEYQEYLEVGEVEYNRKKLATAVNWIRENPGRFLALTAKRIQYFWLPKMERAGQGLLLGVLTVFAVAGLIRLLLNRHHSAGVFLSIWVTFPLVYYLVQFVGRYRVIILWSVLLVATTLIVWAIRNLLPYEGESD